MFGVEGIFPVFVITLACLAFAVLALVGVGFSLFLWIKHRRKTASAIGIPALLYLAAILWLSTPRPLPRHTVYIDLRHPTELSGIPDGTQWFADPGPSAPKSAVALSPSGGFCCVEGNVTFTIILPNGLPICDQARELYIKTDDKGIWEVDASIFGMKIDKAVASFERNLRPLVLSPELKISNGKSLDETIQGFSGEITNRSYNFGFYLKSPTFNFQFMPGAFQQKNALNYNYIVDLPHIEAYARPHPLPKVANPAQLVQDCRNILKSIEDRDVPSDQWTPSMHALNPIGVSIRDGIVILFFQPGAQVGFPPVVGSHDYVIGPQDALAEDHHRIIMSNPYPGIYEALCHD